MKGFLLVVCFIGAAWSQRELGLEDFCDIRESNTFVDKTLLIKEIFRQDRILIITAPKYFGKTINFEMINLFLRNDQNDTRAEMLFKETKIWADKKFLNEHMNNYPVLYCNFDSGLEVMCEETLLTYYRQILYGIFIEHDYLKVSAALSESQRKLFNSYIDDNENLEKWKVQTGLRFITECLHLHHAKKVIVLIDEYDAIVINEIFNNENSTVGGDDDYLNITREIVLFQNSLLSSTLDNNNHIERAILTGTLPLDIFQSVSGSSVKIKSVGFTENKYFTPFYGFTQKEVDRLMKNHNLTADQQTEVKKWYDGYTSVKGKVRIMNPWDLTKFLEHKLAHDYWVKLFPLTDILLPLMEHSRVQETMVKIVQATGELNIKIKKTLSISDLENLKKIVNNRWDGEMDMDIFYQFLLQVGYLTFDNPRKDFQDTSIHLLRIPNREIRQELSKMIKQYFSKMREGKK